MTPARRNELAELGAAALLTLATDKVPSADQLEALNAIVLWFASSPAPGYWEVHDYADGWIPFATEAAAKASPEALNGCSVRMVPFCG